MKGTLPAGQLNHDGGPFAVGLGLRILALLRSVGVGVGGRGLLGGGGGGTWWGKGSRLPRLRPQALAVGPPPSHIILLSFTFLIYKVCTYSLSLLFFLQACLQIQQDHAWKTFGGTVSGSQ